MEIANAKQFHIPAEMMTGDTVVIPIGELYRQLTKVLRVRSGDNVRFFDGVGNVAEGTVAHVNKEGILVPIANRFNQPRGTHVTLAIGILKNDRMRAVLEKATELGVSRIIPMLTERVVKRPAAPPPRWQHIVREAAEQCGRAWLPQIDAVKDYRDILKAGGDLVFYTTRADITDMPAPRLSEPILLIGPEGGFTDQEVALAQDHHVHFASLGGYQLRADTAAIVAVSQQTT